MAEEKEAPKMGSEEWAAQEWDMAVKKRTILSRLFRRQSPKIKKGQPGGEPQYSDVSQAFSCGRQGKP